uniref:Uncharacterized protein n=1 Tax=Anguilla anguilla TaxID=7936 RepID=A0A0E9TMS5_ANGAN
MTHRPVSSAEKSTSVQSRQL